MKKTITFFALFTMLLTLCVFSGCEKKSLWHADLEEAKHTASKKNLDIFLLFSGEDWDGKTTAFRTDVLDTEEFKSFAKQYVLTRVDFSMAEYEKSAVKDDATEEEKKEAERILAEYEKKDALSVTYNIKEYPSICILSKEGFPLAIIPYEDDIKSTADLSAKIEEQRPQISEVTQLIMDVRQSSGAAKVTAIDAFFERMEPELRASIEPLIREIPALDKDNSSGLLGKYELWTAYLELEGNIRNKGSDKEAVQPLIEAAEHGHLDADQRQQAYYTAAYMLASLGNTDFDYMFSLLKKAQEAAPSSGHLDYIEMMRNALNAMKNQMNVSGND